MRETRDDLSNSQTHNWAAPERQWERKSVRRLLRAAAGVLVVGAVLMTSACASRINVRGNDPDPDLLTEILKDHASRNKVTQLIGTPSSVAMFSNNETWLYISKTTEAFAFFEPKVVKQTVVVVQFSDNDKVTKIDTLGVSDGQVVTLNKNKTPTMGNEMNEFQQLLSNMGRFNQDKKTTQ